MASIRFHLRNTVKKKLAPVYLRFSASREVVYDVKTGYEVDPQYWSKSRQELSINIVYNGILNDEELAEQRKKYINLRHRVENELNNITSQGVKPSKEWLESVIYDFNNPVKKPDKIEFLLDYMERFINEIESGDRLHSGGMKYRPGTIKSYKGTKAQIIEFQKREKLRFDDITLDLYNDLLKFFNKKKYSQNSIGRHIKNLKVVMRAAREDGYHNNLEIERKGFRTLKEKVINI